MPIDEFRIDEDSDVEAAKLLGEKEAQYVVGDHVEGLSHSDQQWYNAIIVEERPDGTFEIAWDDEEDKDTIKDRSELRHDRKADAMDPTKLCLSYWRVYLIVIIGIVFEVILCTVLYRNFNQEYAWWVFSISLIVRITIYIFWCVCSTHWWPCSENGKFKSCCTWACVHFIRDNICLRNLKDKDFALIYVLVMLPFCFWLPWLDATLISNCGYDTFSVDVANKNGTVYTFHHIKCPGGVGGPNILPWLNVLIICLAVFYAKTFFKSGVPQMTIIIMLHLRQTQILIINIFDACVFCTRVFQLDGFRVLNSSTVVAVIFLSALSLGLCVELLATSVIFRLPRCDQYDVVITSAMSFFLNVAFFFVRVVLLIYEVEIEWWLLAKNIVGFVYDISCITAELGPGYRYKQCRFKLERMWDLLPGAWDISNWVLNDKVSRQIMIIKELTVTQKEDMIDYAKWEIEQIVPYYPLKAVQGSTKLGRPSAKSTPPKPREGCAFPVLNWKCFAPDVGIPNGAPPQWRVVPGSTDGFHPDDIRDYLEECFHSLDEPGAQGIPSKRFVAKFKDTRPEVLEGQCCSQDCISCTLLLFYLLLYVLINVFLILFIAYFYGAAWQPWLGFIISPLMTTVVPPLIYVILEPAPLYSRERWLGIFEYSLCRLAMFLAFLLPLCVWFPVINSKLIYACPYESYTNSSFLNNGYMAANLSTTISLTTTTSTTTSTTTTTTLTTTIINAVLLGTNSSANLSGSTTHTTATIGSQWNQGTVGSQWNQGTVGSQLNQAPTCSVDIGVADKMVLRIGTLDMWFLILFFKKLTCFVLPLAYVLGFFNSPDQLMIVKMTRLFPAVQILVIDFFDVCLFATAPWQLKGFLFFKEAHSSFTIFYLIALPFTLLTEIVATSLVFGLWRALNGAQQDHRHEQLQERIQEESPFRFRTVNGNFARAEGPDPRWISGMSLVLNMVLLAFRVCRVYFFWHGVEVELLLVLKNILCIIYDVALIAQLAAWIPLARSDKRTSCVDSIFDFMFDVFPNVKTVYPEAAREVRSPLTDREERKRGAGHLNGYKSVLEKCEFYKVIVTTQWLLEMMMISFHQVRMQQQVDPPMEKLKASLQKHLLVFVRSDSPSEQFVWERTRYDAPISYLEFLVKLLRIQACPKCHGGKDGGLFSRKRCELCRRGSISARGQLSSLNLRQIKTVQALVSDLTQNGLAPIEEPHHPHHPHHAHGPHGRR